MSELHPPKPTTASIIPKSKISILRKKIKTESQKQKSLITASLHFSHHHQISWEQKKIQNKYDNLLHNAKATPRLDDSQPNDN